MGGDWQTAADATATSKIALDKFESATLGATADWTYGPADAVVPTGEGASRALTLGDHSKLTFAAGTRTITLAEPIDGAKASVKLASGTLRLAASGQTLDALTFAGGDLAVTEAIAGDDWTTVLTANKIAGTPAFGDGVRGRIVENSDGTFAVQVKRVKGLLVIIQ